MSASGPSGPLVTILGVVLLIVLVTEAIWCCNTDNFHAFIAVC